MGTTTFGYDAMQDRLWMRVNDTGRTVWLTRRMVSHILGPVLKAFESAVPGAEGGAPTATRASIEHELALHEGPPGQAAPVIRVGRVAVQQPVPPRLLSDLCTRLVATTGVRQVTLQFMTTGEPVVMQMSRRGMHLWLQGLVLVLAKADWQLPQPLPDWLQCTLLPPAVRDCLPPQ